MARQCSWNREITSELAAQFARCPKCPAIIYACDKGIPCERHRIVAEWRTRYHSPAFTAEVAEARARAAEHRAAPRTHRQLAAEQVAEARAARVVLT